jgi:hypothetical protein
MSLLRAVSEGQARWLEIGWRWLLQPGRIAAPLALLQQPRGGVQRDFFAEDAVRGDVLAPPCGPRVSRFCFSVLSSIPPCHCMA